MAKFKLSSTTISFKELSLEDGIRKLASLGFDGVELPVAYQFETNSTTKEDRARISGLIRDQGMELAGFHWAIPKGYSYVCPDEKERRRCIDYFKREIDMAEEMGCGVITLGSGYTRTVAPEWSWEDAARWAREAWEEWAEHIKGMKTAVGIEVLSRLFTNYLITIDECSEFLKGILGPNIGLTIDTTHMAMEEGDLLEPLERHGEHVKFVHIAENNRQRPGRGHFPFYDVLGKLAEKGYTGYLSFELDQDFFGRPLMGPPEEELRVGKQVLEGIVGRL